MTAQNTPSVSPEQRHLMIAEAAFFHAEHNGFQGDPLADWLAAEAEIDSLLKQTQQAPDGAEKKAKPKGSTVAKSAKTHG
ncbi:MAG: DUF2934 domain-containing protein [Thiomonas sp.]